MRQLVCALALSFFVANAVNAQEIVFPIEGNISSPYGTRKHPIVHKLLEHLGVDIPAQAGTHIRAIGKGRVIFSGEYGGYGNLIVILHGNEISTHYAHCQELYVNVGQNVRAGEIIGSVGKSGMATGPHLHLEFRQSGVPQDPSEYLPGLLGVRR